MSGDRAAPHDRLVSRLSQLPLAELRQRFESRGPTAAVLRALQMDPRAGVRQLARRLERRRVDERRERRRLARLYTEEAALRGAPGDRVAGVDEVGMGPLAGPVVAAAVVLPDRPHLASLDDSKRLRPSVRAELARAIRELALGIGIGVAVREEIDRLNIYHAGLLAMRRAVEGLASPPDVVALDGRTLPDLDLVQRRCVGGDARIACIAAASVVAKEHRDALMRELDVRYPGYGFARHAGYATPEHLAALRRLGPTPEHRQSFAPVRQRSLFGEADCPTS